MTTAPGDPPGSPGIHVPSLAVGLGIMIVGTLYPPMMTRAGGGADHALATLLFWSMSAGLVRGVGFVPRHAGLRWLLSAWACGATLMAAVAWKLGH